MPDCHSNRDRVADVPSLVLGRPRVDERRCRSAGPAASRRSSSCRAPHPPPSGRRRRRNASDPSTFGSACSQLRRPSSTPVEPAGSRRRSRRERGTDRIRDDELRGQGCRRWPCRCSSWPTARGSTSAPPGSGRSSARSRWPRCGAGCAAAFWVASTADRTERAPVDRTQHRDDRPTEDRARSARRPTRITSMPRPMSEQARAALDDEADGDHARCRRPAPSRHRPTSRAVRATPRGARRRRASRRRARSCWPAGPGRYAASIVTSTPTAYDHDPVRGCDGERRPCQVEAERARTAP